MLPPPEPPPPLPKSPDGWPGAEAPAPNNEEPLPVVVVALKRLGAEVVGGLLLDPNRLLGGCEEAVLCCPNSVPEELPDVGLAKLNGDFA